MQISKLNKEIDNSDLTDDQKKKLKLIVERSSTASLSFVMKGFKCSEKVLGQSIGMIIENQGVAKTFLGILQDDIDQFSTLAKFTVLADVIANHTFTDDIEEDINNILSQSEVASEVIISHYKGCQNEKEKVAAYSALIHMADNAAHKVASKEPDYDISEKIEGLFATFNTSGFLELNNYLLSVLNTPFLVCGLIASRVIDGAFDMEDVKYPDIDNDNKADQIIPFVSELLPQVIEEIADFGAVSLGIMIKNIFEGDDLSKVTLELNRAIDRISVED